MFPVLLLLLLIFFDSRNREARLMISAIWAFSWVSHCFRNGGVHGQTFRNLNTASQRMPPLWNIITPLRENLMYAFLWRWKDI